MGSAPLHVASPHRLLLADFERRYAHWQAVRAAAESAALELSLRLQEPAGGRPVPKGPALQRVLDLHAAALRLHHDAVQPLRDTPI